MVVISFDLPDKFWVQTSHPLKLNPFPAILVSSSLFSRATGPYQVYNGRISFSFSLSFHQPPTSSVPPQELPIQICCHPQGGLKQEQGSLASLPVSHHYVLPPPPALSAWGIPREWAALQNFPLKDHQAPYHCFLSLFTSVYLYWGLQDSKLSLCSQMPAPHGCAFLIWFNLLFIPNPLKSLYHVLWNSWAVITKISYVSFTILCPHYPELTASLTVTLHGDMFSFHITCTLEPEGQWVSSSLLTAASRLLFIFSSKASLEEQAITWYRPIPSAFQSLITCTAHLLIHWLFSCLAYCLCPSLPVIIDDPSNTLASQLPDPLSSNALFPYSTYVTTVMVIP